MSEAALNRDEIAPLAQPSSKLASLSNQELLSSTRRLVGATNQILAELLAHLAEVEARGAHRVRLCTSLYAYCIYELQFSEDAAYRRVTAARLLPKFPVLYDVIASGELHLTGLLQLCPHLTSENISEVLARAKHRTKKEISKLVRQLSPLPSVPARIEPLGPELPSPIKLRNPTWEEWLLMLNPVNHLLPGDRPRDWMSNTPFSFAPEPAKSNAIDGASDWRVVAPKREEQTNEVPRGSGTEIDAHSVDKLGCGAYSASDHHADGHCFDEHYASELHASELHASEHYASELHTNGHRVGENCANEHHASELYANGHCVDEHCASQHHAGEDHVDKPHFSESAWKRTSDEDVLRQVAAGDFAAPEPAARSRSVRGRVPATAPLTPPLRYAVQFTVGQRYVDLVARAQALLSHRSKGSLEDVHLQAMELLVEELERSRFGTSKRTRPALEAAAEGEEDAKTSKKGRAKARRRERTKKIEHTEERELARKVDARNREGDQPIRDDGRNAESEVEATEAEAEARASMQEGGEGRFESDVASDPSKKEAGRSVPRQRGRWIPTAVRRAVFERDGLRCTHVENGERCAETRWLQFHHLHAFARGGKHQVDNVTLRCRAHNLAAAEQDFGAEMMRAAKEQQRSESFVAAENDVMFRLKQ